MKTIELKTDPIPFRAVRDGLKTLELRFNDRDYQVGDHLTLRETVYCAADMKLSPSAYPLQYTGEQIAVEITHIVDAFSCGLGYGLGQGWVALSIKLLHSEVSEPLLTNSVEFSVNGKRYGYAACASFHGNPPNFPAQWDMMDESHQRDWNRAAYAVLKALYFQKNQEPNPSDTQWREDVEIHAKNQAVKIAEQAKEIEYLQMQIKRLQPEKPKDVKVSVYHKPCPHCGGLIDVYDILEMFGPISHTIGHAIKKLLVLGARLGGKSVEHDAGEAIWSIQRFLEQRKKRKHQEGCEVSSMAERAFAKMPDSSVHPDDPILQEKVRRTH